MAADHNPMPELQSAGPLLALRGLGKSYATPVLRDVHLDLLAGEVHALMGANGAGKSTLARIAGGLIRPKSGAMSLLGNPYRPREKSEAQAPGGPVGPQGVT